jgi:hypothetical protein
MATEMTAANLPTTPATPTTPVPPRFDAAVLATYEAEWQAADRARAAAEHRYAVASTALAGYLAQHGPREIGGWRLVGLRVGGSGAVVRELAIAAPAGPDPMAVRAADAACAVEVRDDDGEID